MMLAISLPPPPPAPPLHSQKGRRQITMQVVLLGELQHANQSSACTSIKEEVCRLRSPGYSLQPERFQAHPGTWHSVASTLRSALEAQAGELPAHITSRNTHTVNDLGLSAEAPQTPLHTLCRNIPSPLRHRHRRRDITYHPASRLQLDSTADACCHNTLQRGRTSRCSAHYETQ
jgi:hypothetical protein